MKQSIITNCVFWLSLLMAFSLHGQSGVEIERDTVYFDGQKGGVIANHNRVTVIRLKKKAHKRLYGQLLKNMAGSKAKRVKVKTDPYVFKYPVKVLNNRVWYGEKEIGILKELDEGFKVEVSNLGVDSSLAPYVRREIVAYLHSLYESHYNIDVKVKFTDRYYRKIERLEAKKLREKRKAEMLRRRADSIRYVSWIKKGLKDIDENGIAGVYNNYGAGLKYNYMVAILKNKGVKGAWTGWVLESTNPFRSPIWQPFFKLYKTAAKSKYLLYFGLRNKSKLATFDNNIIDLNDIGFIKINVPGYVDQAPERKKDIISTGSGFFLGKNRDYVVTNKHVVDNSVSQGYCINIRYMHGDSSLVKRQFNVVAQAEKTDLAILKSEGGNKVKADSLILNVNLNPKLGMEIESYGYPSPGLLGLDVQRNVGTVTRSYDSKQGRTFIQTDLPAWYGYSGGPVYGISGKLLGIITSMIYDGREKIENVTYLSSAENLLALLKESKIAFSLSKGGDSSSPSVEDLAERAVLIFIKQCP